MPSGCSRLGRNFRARTLGAALAIVPGGIGISADSRIALEPAGRQRKLASFFNPVAPKVL